MTKTDFENLVTTHHAMFNEISFPEGWMETVNYIGADVKNAGGKYADDYGSTWTSHWSDWTAVSKISGDTISNHCFFGYKWENDKIVEVNAIFPDEAFNKELAMFMEANKKIFFKKFKLFFGEVNNYQTLREFKKINFKKIEKTIYISFHSYS